MTGEEMKPKDEQASMPSGGGQYAEVRSGLDPKIAAFLAYFLGLIGGIVFLLIDKDNKFVRFSALQSIFFSVALIIVWVVYTVVASIIGVIPILGAIIDFILWAAIALAGLVVWIMLMVKALKGETYKLPVIGDMAEQRA